MSEENMELAKTPENLQEEKSVTQQEHNEEATPVASTLKDTVTSLIDTSTEAGIDNSTKKRSGYRLLRIVFSIGFVVFAFLFLNEVFITPYRINKSIEKANHLYKPVSMNSNDITPTPSPTLLPIDRQEAEEELQESVSEKSPVIIDYTRDSQGRLLQFRDLLAMNEDVKGWLTIPESNIDYVVMQSGIEDPEYYLTRDIEKQELKAGSLFLDYHCSVENSSQNLTIHGHNMASTDNMFHYLLNYKELDYYKLRPVFTFDTIYQKAQWKIFSVFITNGGSEKEEFFDYTKASFQNSEDFLEFVYQLRIRSMLSIDTVDINEEDQLLTLSTCSYEVKNYRTVIVARKVREGEAPTVEVDKVIINPEPLYPYSYYYRYGGKAPKLTESFTEALSKGEINWYIPTL